MRNNKRTNRIILWISLLTIMGLSLACSLPFNIPGDVVPQEWQPQEEPFHEEGPQPEDPDMGAEPHPEEPDMGEEPHPEDPDMMEEPHPEEPPHEEPLPESEGKQPEGEDEVPYTDLALTDIYPGKLPHGNLFVRITNHGPTILMAAPVELTCHARGHRWANQTGEDNRSNTVQLVVQLGPGETTNENTGIKIDANLYEYEVECFFDSPLDNTPHNNNAFEVIPNP